MNHLDEGLLQAYADDELPGDERSSVEVHLEGCLACRSELRDLGSLGEQLTAALSLLDRPAPAAAGSASAAGALRPAQPRWSGWRRGVAALPRAAVLVFGVAVGASAMIPGSPLHRLISPEPAAEGGVVAPQREAVALAAPVEEFTAEAGVSIEPLNGEVRVVLRAASPDLKVRASLSTGARASVLASGPAAEARFETAPGRIVVEGLGSGELRIELPGAARAATVEVNGREYLRKQGDQLHLLAPADDRNGTEVNFRP
jgi:anti-sigma factor RsiW